MTDQEAQDLIDERALELRTVLHCSCGRLAWSLFLWREVEGVYNASPNNEPEWHRLLEACDK